VTVVAAAATAGGLLLAGAPSLVETTASADDPAPRIELLGARQHNHPSQRVRALLAHSHRWPGHPGRRVIGYRVRQGDTATGLAVRFHAWTAELLAINDRSSSAALYVGERIRIPVVVAALRKSAHHAHHTHHTRHPSGNRPKHHHATSHQHPAHHHPAHHRAHHTHHAAPHKSHKQHNHPWHQAYASRRTVRGVLSRTADRYGVNQNLALAVSWQESGWQQHWVSSAHAVGAMQVLPSTGRWISRLVGRPLNLYGLHDNAVAGVVLIKVLRDQAGLKHTIAGYYQGLASVQAFGMYDSTRGYVRNVLAIKKMLSHGWDPA
jgi:LysM repeat protein